jgi:protein dithiol:quinone oxidoreductase
MSVRWGYIGGFLICAALIGYALYLQHVEMQDPCPLCILQRVAFMAMMPVFLLGAVHAPARRGALVYSTVLVVIATIGAAIAGRQVWLQQLPASQVPACGPGLEYMLERYPLREVLPKVFAGSGECAEAGWRFLGLTIAGWSLVWFVLLGALAVFLAVLAPRRRRGPSA